LWISDTEHSLEMTQNIDSFMCPDLVKFQIVIYQKKLIIGKIRNVLQKDRLYIPVIFDFRNMNNNQLFEEICSFSQKDKEHLSAIFEVVRENPDLQNIIHVDQSYFSKMKKCEWVRVLNSYLALEIPFLQIPERELAILYAEAILSENSHM